MSATRLFKPFMSASLPPATRFPRKLSTVPDRAALGIVEKRCEEAGIAHRVFVEADLNDEKTALATEPVNGKARRLFADLKLFGD